jgi:hypothetical protein
VRLRSVVLLSLGALLVLGLLRRRAPSEFVDVDFEDGSAIRLARSPEANDLLEDAYTILERA